MSTIKTIIITLIIGFIMGSCITAGAGYWFIVRQDRAALELSRREAIEYRDRAIISEKRLTDSIGIINNGEAKLTATVGTIREAIQQIREIRQILQQLKESLGLPMGSDGS